MSDVINNILKQKLLEIQSQLPTYVKLVKEAEVNFDEVLSAELNQNEKISYKGDYNEIIDQAAKKYNISSALIKAVIKAESNFNPKVESSTCELNVLRKWLKNSVI